MVTNTRSSAVIFLALGIFSPAIYAGEISDRCRADKALRAGVYNVCRLKAQARAYRSAGVADFTKCDARLAAGWAKAEERGAGKCPTSGDAEAIRRQVTADVDAVIVALNPPFIPPPCGDAEFPGCGSPCPPGMSCWAVFAAESRCGCLAATTTACGDSGGPITNGQHCGGACPEGEVCSTLDIDASSLDYSCGCIPSQSMPCLNSSGPLCGGACPSDLQCAPDPLLFDCKCR